MELLETKIAPAVITWVGGDPDYPNRWEAGNNWDLQRRPTAVDEVRIATTGVVQIGGSPVFAGAVVEAGTLISSAVIDLREDLHVVGDAWISGAIDRSQALTFGGRLTIGGDLTLEGPWRLQGFRQLPGDRVNIVGPGTLVDTSVGRAASGSTPESRARLAAAVTLVRSHLVAAIPEEAIVSAVLDDASSLDVHNAGALHASGAGRITLVNASTGLADINVPDIFGLTNVGGVVNIDGDFTSDFDGIVNFGTIVKRGGSGVSTTVGFEQSDEGRLVILAGHLRSEWGGLGGLIEVAEGRTLTIGGGMTTEAGAVIRGEGIVAFDQLDSGFGRITGRGALSVEGQFLWRSGTLGGEFSDITPDEGPIVVVAPGGRMTVDTTNNPTLSGRELSNAGLIEVIGDGRLQMESPFIIRPGEDMFSPDASFHNRAAGIVELRAGDLAAVENDGLLRKSGPGASQVGGLDNRGVVEVLAGRLVLSTGLTFHSPGQGSIRLAGGDIEVLQGSLAYYADLTGRGTIFGSVSNSNDNWMSPGAGAGTGVLTIDPGASANTTAFVNGFSGTLRLQIGGYQAGVGFDQIAIAGNPRVVLSGTLDLELIGGFTPKVGDRFQVMTFSGPKSGLFRAINGTRQGALTLRRVFTRSGGQITGMAIEVAGNQSRPLDVVDDAARTKPGKPLTINVLANDGGDALEVCEVNGFGTRGSVVINPDNTITFTPDAGFTGSTTFRYTVQDGEGNVGTATVTVRVSEQDELPDIELLDATARVTGGLRDIHFTYSVSGGDAPAGFKARAYLSADETFDPGEDEALPGELTIAAADARAGIDGGARVYETSKIGGGRPLRLDQRAPLTKARRFIIVVLDDDESVEESDETNNAIFVIPLFRANEKGGFHPSTGAFQVVGTAGSLKTESQFAGAITRRIGHGTAAFGALKNIASSWASYGGTIKNEEKTAAPPYTGDDARVNAALVPLVREYGRLARLARQAGRLETKRMEITEALDVQGEHANDSLHYEGRAIDLAGDRGDAASLERLTGLAMLAGFHWMENEGDHVHMSARGAGRAASVTVDDLIGALNHARASRPPGVTDRAVYTRLVGRLQKLKVLLRRQSLKPAQRRDALRQIGDFIKDVNASRSRLRFGLARGAKSKTAGLLPYNADRLRRGL